MRGSCAWIPNEPSGWRVQVLASFDELDDLGWDLQRQAQKVEREARESEVTG